ncbi:hypothetical protein BDZ94DRAFT_1185309 [Collybia nuda]|uniref:DUF2470 domain-containing protein n=1 Tax=Collybia nuda TaxID=64659 RepID=A0A9P5YF97_9AGAR|nr:hypothetical protein BDZ94DRAFT_1185309 [Collybia nuda]
MSDPVADKSGFLRMYMSNHPDTLVAYAKWYGKVNEPISSAEMTEIDSKSMTLGCTMKTGEKKVVRITLNPPLSGYDDVKPRLLEMKAIAQENLGMIKTPTISSFQWPGEVLGSGLLVGTIAYFALSPSNSSFSPFALAQIGYNKIGRTPFTYALYFVYVTHVLESMYTFTLCRKHKTGFFVGSAYVLATLVFGFPIWSDFRKRVQAARIDSVMKVE